MPTSLSQDVEEFMNKGELKSARARIAISLSLGESGEKKEAFGLAHEFIATALRISNHHTDLALGMAEVLTVTRQPGSRGRRKSKIKGIHYNK